MNKIKTGGFGMPKPSFTQRLYKLDGKMPVPCHDVLVWSEENRKGMDPAHGAPWRVGRDWVGEYEISTVFLGINMANGFGARLDNTPILFETMMFGPNSDIAGMGRSTTYEIAEARHREVVERVREIIQAGKRVEDMTNDE